MTEASTETLTVVVERQLPYPPEKIWRALTQPALLEEWLMKTDFAPTMGHGFQFKGDWGAVDCRVLEVAANRSLSYSWEAFGLESVVTWTLTPAGGGTNLRMEQTGFRPDQPQFHQGAQASWPQFLDKLEQILGQID
jgi:uncharacterized protein YndB with AHSA1/START domain